MERKKYLFVMVICAATAFSVPSTAQNSYRHAAYEAYISGDMKEWERVIGAMESENLRDTRSQLELLEYYYGYIGFLIGNGRKAEAKTYISKGENLIDSILRKDPQNPDATAYKGSFIAYRFTINKLKAVVSGMESKRLIEKAYAEDPENVRAISEMANLYYYAPVLFGRDRDKAVELYKKAANRMEESGSDCESWCYLRLLTNIAMHYDAEGEAGKAEAAYRKILDAEPDYLWVRDELYPAFRVRNGVR